MFPTNQTGLSLAGVLMWPAIILGSVILLQAFCGAGLLEGSMAAAAAGGAFAAAWSIWFFWQRGKE